MLSFFKNHRFLTSALAVVFVIAVIVTILHANQLIFFAPLRNKPDEILVYKYGEAVRLIPQDKAFKKIYKGLNRYAPADRFWWSFATHSSLADYQPIAFESGIVVRCIYYKYQHGIGIGSNSDKFKEVFFLLYIPSRQREVMPQDKKNHEAFVIYADIPHDSDNYGTVENWRHAWKVEEYIRKLDISDFPSAEDFPLPFNPYTDWE